MENRLWMAAGVALFLAAGASAQTPSSAGAKGKGGGGGACKADIQSLCAGKKGAEAMVCLSSNAGKIQNSACKSRVEKYQANDSAVKQACSGDITNGKCTGLDIGTGLLKCLGKERKTLSEGCKTELKSLHQQKGGKGMGKGGQGKGEAPAGDSEEPSDQ
jgi:hypothetical protein